METKRMLRAVFILAVCLTIHVASGEAVRTAQETNRTTPHSSEKLGGSRNESIEVGRTVTLLCTNEKIAWSEMIYVIWKINVHNKSCRISVATNDTSFNTCEDGKKMHISAGGDYSLIIPDFSIKDEGNYVCDVSYRAGGYVETIHVSAWARPNLTGWLEDEGGHTFAVCEAKSKLEASIYWKTQWNNSQPKTNSFKDASGLFTVKSRLQLPQNASRNNLTCVVPSPHNWKEIPFNTFKFKAADFSVSWVFILLGVCATCSIVTLLTGLYIMRGKIKQLSVFRKICCTSQIPTPAKEEKTPQPRDPEEVEPYASYVQRVNSIYNSSAELFNA